MIKKRNSFKGSATYIVATLSATALIATGFATWVIISGDSKEAQGTITADAVSDERHMITLGKWDENKDSGSFVFAIKEGFKAEDGASWLTAKDMETGKYEKLDSTLSFSVTNAKNITNENLFEKIELTTASTDFNNLVTNSYLAGLPTTYSDTEDTSSTGSYMYLSRTDNADGTTVDFTLKLHLNWGSKFGNKNPFEYSKEYTGNASDFMDMLKEVYKANNASFKLTIATKA